MLILCKSLSLSSIMRYLLVSYSFFLFVIFKGETYCSFFFAGLFTLMTYSSFFRILFYFSFPFSFSFSFYCYFFFDLSLFLFAFKALLDFSRLLYNWFFCCFFLAEFIIYLIGKLYTKGLKLDFFSELSYCWMIYYVFC